MTASFLKETPFFNSPATLKEAVLPTTSSVKGRPRRLNLRETVKKVAILYSPDTAYDGMFQLMLMGSSPLAGTVRPSAA